MYHVIDSTAKSLSSIASHDPNQEEQTQTEKDAGIVTTGSVRKFTYPPPSGNKVETDQDSLILKEIFMQL